MVRTRSQLENLSKDELIDEVLSLENFKNDINVKFSGLNNRFNDFEAKYEMVSSFPGSYLRMRACVMKMISWPANIVS